MRRVEFRPAASADLEGIFEHIAKDSPKNAIGFVQRIFYGGRDVEALVGEMA